MNQGIIKASQSPFTSPVILVKKKDSTRRMCYRQLNELILKNKYPKPMVEEIFDELHGATNFSKLECLDITK